MARTRIREKDRTTAGKSYGNDVTIFLTDTKAKASIITAITKKADASTYTNKTIIENILDLGGKVLVAAKYDNTVVSYLKDRNQYDVTFLLCETTSDKTTSDETTSDETTSDTDLKLALDIAVARRDCAVVCTCAESEWSNADKTLLNTAIGNETSTEFLDGESGTYGKYCLGFYGKDSTIKGGVAYIYSFLKALNDGNPAWLATAGAKRGAIPVAVTVGDLTEAELDTMQTSGNPVNPIANISPWGVRIWGDRTAMEISSTGPVASNFATVRIAMCWLKKRLYLAAKTYQFEQDNDVLWVNFTSKVNSLLEEMVQSSGIGGYRWLREAADGRGKLKATLTIVPTYPVDDFDLTIDLTDSLSVSE